jgi:hypothetical protein
MAGKSGHGIKRPDHSPSRWDPYNPRKIQKSVNRHIQSAFSNKPDPSLHADRIKRQNLSHEEVKMKIQRSKEIALEARDIQDLARQFSKKAMEVLVKILDNEDSSDTAKISAIGMIFDRGYGKAAMTQVNINANADSKLSELDAGSLDKRIAEAIDRVEKLTVGATEEGEGEERPINLRIYN